MEEGFSEGGTVGKARKRFYSLKSAGSRKKNNNGKGFLRLDPPKIQIGKRPVA